MYKAWGGVEKFSHATLVKSNALACVQGRAKGETYNYFDEPINSIVFKTYVLYKSLNYLSSLAIIVVETLYLFGDKYVLSIPP